MATAIKVHEFAEAGAGLAPAPVPAAGALFRQQPRPLQRGFDVRIRQREAMLAPRDVMKVTGVEAGVVLPIELQKALHFAEGRLARRRPPAPAIEQAVVAVVLKAPAPAPQTARCTPDNLRRLDPADLAAHGSQHDLANRHGPLQGRRRIEHRRPPGRHSGPPGPAERTDQLLRRADRSCAPYIRSRNPVDIHIGRA